MDLVVEALLSRLQFAAIGCEWTSCAPAGGRRGAKFGISANPWLDEARENSGSKSLGIGTSTVAHRLHRLTVGTASLSRDL